MCHVETKSAACQRQNGSLMDQTTPSHEAGIARRLYFEDSGKRATATRPIVFLHGWACHGGYFAPQFEGLADRFRLIAPDLRGHRFSRRADGPLDLAALADDLKALLDRLALPAPILVGWSMGALVAFEFIRRQNGAGVAGLVVVDMTPRVVNDAGWDLGLLGGYGSGQAEKAPELMRRDWPLWVETFLPSVFAAGRLPAPPLLDWVRREMRACDPEAMAALWRAITDADYRAIMQSITAPTLIVRGAESQLYGAGTAAWLARAIPTAEVATVPQAGHAPHLEQPALFNRLLAEFVDRVK
jgi:pimeloyl-[acyl-carrier protein] methyl ester esterase